MTTTKDTIENVRKIFKDNQCELLSTIYINKTEKLEYVCKCGKKHSKSLKYFEKRPFCDYCGRSQRNYQKPNNKTKKYTIEIVRKIFSDAGCKLLSTEYKHIEDKLDYICICGHESKITLHSFNRGGRCLKCAVKKRKQNIPFDKSYVNKILAKYGCELISDYEKSNKPIIFKCKCGNNGKKTFTNFQRHPYCRKCTFFLQTQQHKRTDLDQVETEKKLKVYVGGAFREMLTGSKTRKSKLEKFGYGSKEFIEHISKFNIYSKNRKDFSIDHIFPFKAFFEHNIWDLKVINHLSNIQLLTRSDNCKKNKEYNQQDFYDWLESIGYHDYEKQI